MEETKERYPNYKAVIPPADTYDIVVEFSINDLDNALKHFTKADRITLEFSDKEFFKIKSRYKEVFIKARVHGLDFPSDIFLSDIGFAIDFDPRLLKEFTDAIRGNSYIIKAFFKDDDETPALFKVNDAYFYLVMPLKFEKP